MKSMKFTFVRSSAAVVMFAALLMLPLFSSCTTGGIVDNPPPFLQFVEGPAENETILQDRTLISWKGNGTDYNFRYRLLSLDKDNFPSTYQDWTDYGQASEAALTYLDDGKYAFEVQAKSGTIEPPPLRKTFFVNALKGPALTFFKTKTTMKFNTIDSVAVWMEDVDSLSAFRVVITFDRFRFKLRSVNPGLLASEKGMKQLILPEFTSGQIDIANSVGKIEINSAFMRDLNSGSATSITGSGKILGLVFEAFGRGTTNLEMISVDLRKINGKPIVSSPPKAGILISQ